MDTKGIIEIGWRDIGLFVYLSSIYLMHIKELYGFLMDEIVRTGSNNPRNRFTQSRNCRIDNLLLFQKSVKKRTNFIYLNLLVIYLVLLFFYRNLLTMLAYNINKKIFIHYYLLLLSFMHLMGTARRLVDFRPLLILILFFGIQFFTTTINRTFDYC